MSDMIDLATLSIADAGRMLRARKVSAVELARASLARIAAIDGAYNAFIQVTAELALAQAAEADAEIASGRWRGPMHGVPYGLKDLADVAGLPTTCHSKVRSGHRADGNAFVVDKLRNAGAVLVGKLALHEFATGGPTLDLPWPPARNPWDRNVHPGGSSSGSATAVALGLVPGAIGTDTGGSIRNPATCCGIVGLKPTYGLVSRSGVVPLAVSLDHVGPMTRTVEDNAIMLQLIAGHDPADPTSVRGPVPDYRTDMRAGIKGRKIGVIEHFFTEDAAATEAQTAAFARAVDELRKLGAEVRSVRLSPLARWSDCGRTILQSEAFAAHEKTLQERPEDYAEITRKRILPGGFLPAVEYIKAQQLRTLLTAEFNEAMRDFDAVVTLSSLEMPARFDDPKAIAATYDRHCRMPFNVTGTPAIAVPSGFTSAGLPLGFQIASAAFNEAMLFRIAQAYDEATGWCEHRPSVSVTPRPRSEAPQ
jgi:aspartyl-tRNA(Asn)/glutamyl-tRNA(Gln) amidotransferase subunit A